MSGYTQHEMQAVDQRYQTLVHARDKMYHCLSEALNVATSKAQRDAMRSLVETARALGRSEALNGVSVQVCGGFNEKA